MCPICGLAHFDPELPWIVQHMVGKPPNVKPADEILCNHCYNWYSKIMHMWLHKGNDAPTVEIAPISYGRI